MKILALFLSWLRNTLKTPGKQNLISALKEAIAGNQDGMRVNIKELANGKVEKLKVLVDAMDGDDR